ncbi:MAG: MBL fold metallo-hydrolase [Clostridiales bacterium]|nr:MAG: MBL fold metallo-hydrolase [Clostridiales bacterium]
MTRLYPFFSSSKGNCTLLMSDGHGLLIDCGVSFSQIQRSFKAADISPGALDGILLTHAHSDHIRAVPQLFQKNIAPFYANASTLSSAGITGVNHENRPFSLGPFRITPIETSHDVDSCGYRIETARGALAIVTDTGRITPAMMQHLSGCSLIMLESNYDPDMLENGPYPAVLKARIRSAHGHLSNADCASLLALKALEGTLKTAVLAHLSDHNNTPLTARMAVLSAFSQYGVEDIRLEVGGPFCPPLEVSDL